MTQRICPKPGETCPIEERLALISDFLPSHAMPIARVCRAVRAVSRASSCEGVIVDDDSGDLTVAYCGNENAAQMAEIVLADATKQKLDTYLFSNLHQVRYPE